LPKIDQLVKTAKKMGMESLALTDNGNLYGAIEFYQECEKKELKPIIGVDFYVAFGSRHDRRAGIDKERYRLVLLAENLTGYKNLIQLVTISHLEGFYYKPRVDKEILEKYSEGLIAIAPSFSSDIIKSLSMSREDEALTRLDWYKKVFATGNDGDNFFIEITHHPEIKGHQEKMKMLVDFARKTKTPLVAAQDVYYMLPEDRPARETLMSVMNTGDFSDRGEEKTDDFSFISPETAETYFKDLPEALQNNQKIASRCNLKLELGKWVFPDFKVESGLSPGEELKRLTYEGLARRGVEQTKEVTERMEYELGIINTKGYAPYFLVVGDLMRFARENGILSNIRGSVSGSLVTYLAGITNINPLEYDIPFERFLNPDRPSPPDIDMDFADNRRDEMVEYAKRKYGVDKVAQIGTFGTMAARGSVRDVTRAMGFPYALGDSLAKMIPIGAQGFPMTIDRALNEVPELKERYEKEADVKTIIDMAKKIEGCARHMGIHAAGVVMAPTPITDYTPLQYDPKGEGKIITQYDMYSIEEAGLLKFDFLGLRNLSIIADTLTLIKKLDSVTLTTEEIPIDDRKTFEMLARGETSDLFQLNGDGMTRFLVDLKPAKIHDINAMVALYRPGPLQFIPMFIEGKHNSNKIKYLDPMLKPILEKTYGVLVYQDDLLMMARNIAGYTWMEVDKFRKAVGKKIPKEMQEQKEKFINGCVDHSKWPLQKAQELWTWIEPFAAYGFNKAHSVSYGLVAYQTAYLKSNFPAEYMASVLTHHDGDVEKVSESVVECKRIGIQILPPDINESFKDFTVIKSKISDEKDSIRFGLNTIKNFGEGISESIISERKKNGPFKTLSDFLRRIKDKNLNKKSLESLVKAGAMDSLGDRFTLLHNLDRLLTFHKEETKSETAQDSLFGLFSGGQTHDDVHLEKAPEGNLTNRLQWEKELLGLYISGHPLDSFKSKLDGRETTIKKLLETAKDKQPVVFGGMIEEIKPIMTKKGDKMAFIKVADLTGSIETVAFPKVLVEFSDILAPESCVVIKGTLSVRNGEKSVLVEKVKVMV
jgi:DNA polymerase-3 subunit alpha